MKHVILDIDDTIRRADFLTGRIEVKYRLGLKDFLKFLFDVFESVSIWSSGQPSGVRYCEKYLTKKYLPPNKKFRLVYDCRECIRKRDEDNELYFIKKLRKIWRRHKDMTKYNTFILDDDPMTFQYNYGNALQIPEFVSDDDMLLPKLQKALIWLKDKDFRMWNNRKVALFLIL